jgi:methylenetetrahydrofolate reductase (NADPH)
LTPAGREEFSGHDVGRLLVNARLEVVPMKGTDALIPLLPRGATVTVTCSPTRGLEPTLHLTERLAAEGLHAVPHISARLVESTDHLQAILGRLGDIHTTEIFVIGGDARAPAGPFESAAGMLQAMTEMAHGVERVGVAAYPERHPFVHDEELHRALLEKQPHAHYMVSQICFDATLILGWLDRARARGIFLPLYIGFPGVVSLRRLLTIALRIGVGDSARFLGGHVGTVTKLARSGRYSPTALLADLAPRLTDITGFHINTFNEIESTERWKRDAIKAAAHTPGRVRAGPR